MKAIAFIVLTSLLAVLGPVSVEGYIADLNQVQSLEEAALDSIPPGRPQIWIREVRRAGDSDFVCEMGMGRLSFWVHPPDDDRSGPLDLGYQFSIVGGDPPPGFEWPEKPQRALSVGYQLAAGPKLVGTVYVRWHEERARLEATVAPFRFAVVAYAVDKGGNVGEPSDTVWVANRSWPDPDSYRPAELVRRKAGR